MSWLVPPASLSPDQQQAVQLPPSHHRVVIGGPGSGKTQILLHRARFLVDSFHTAPDRFRLFVFTNGLKNYLRPALADLGLPEDNVSTFDHWCRTWYQEHIAPRLPWDTVRRCPDFDAIRRAVADRAASGPPLFDFLMVDEGQDLPEDVFALLSRISRHITVCLDPHQQLYDSGASLTAILRQLERPRPDFILATGFRVCPYLIEIAARFLPDPAARLAFLNQPRPPQSERETPVLSLPDSFESDRSLLHLLVRERQLKGDRIGILLAQNKHVFGCARHLLEAGIPIEVPQQKSPNPPFPPHDFSSPLPKLMSFHSAKGLSFDSVFMPGLSPATFPHTPTTRLQHLLFVATTRATRWCFFSSPAFHPLPLLIDSLTPLTTTGHLTLLHPDTRSAPNPAGTIHSPPPPPPAGALDFL